MTMKLKMRLHAPDAPKVPGTLEQVANRRKLYDALKSGKYKQTDGTLQDSTGFCCLGVACDISGVGHWEGENSLMDFVDDVGHKTNSRAAGSLTALAQAHYGMDASGTLPRGVDGFDEYTSTWCENIAFTMIDLNDAAMLSFEEIADWFAENYEIEGL